MRRKWLAELKFEPGASVASVARPHAINAS
jgi:transposase-like protein